ncbi:MAG: 15,15' beta carotene dioxygenase [Candidatus Babeliales bacterium]
MKLKTSYVSIILVSALSLAIAATGYYIIQRQNQSAPLPAPEIIEPPIQPTEQIEEPKEIEPEVESLKQEDLPTPELVPQPLVQEVKPKAKARTKKPQAAALPLPIPLPTSRAQHPVCSHELGFKSLKEQVSHQKLSIQGTIPNWLQGSFVSVGPAIFEIGDTKAAHWLDGLAMIYQWNIEDQSIIYSNQLIESGYCKDCLAKGKLRGSTPEQKKSTWAKLTSAVSSAPRPIYDNTNINVACFNNQLIALTETPHGMCIDTKTLQTTGQFTFDDHIETQYTSPHPLFDPNTQEWYGIGIHYAHNSNYVIYKMGKNSTKRTVIATIPVGYPSYLHSFGMTEHYIILTETPFTVSPYDLLLSDTAFIDNFNWKPKNGSTFTLIDKRTGKKVGIYKTKAFFALHHVNAYEENGKVIVDLMTFKNPSITKAFAYENLCNPNLNLPAAHLKRFTINLEEGTVKSYKMSPHNIELPNINPHMLMRKYQYMYATSNEHGFAQHIFKLGLYDKHHQQWHEINSYPTEAIFVPRPGSTQEDDGAIISLVLDAAEKKSFLLILDAKNLKELARAYMPHAIPFTVHSKFFAK